MAKWPDSDEVCRQIATTHPEVMLAFSGGKDAVACWLQLRKHFSRVVPVHYYLIPDLGFVEQGLQYFEKVFGERIIRVPHPSLYRWISNWVFQSPENWRAEVLSGVDLPNLNYEQLHQFVASEVWPDRDPRDHWIAVGVRACDSPHRRMAFDKWGPVNAKKRSFWPVADWNKAKVVAEIKAAGVLLPAEYRVFGRSFDGIDFRFLHGIQKHWPSDYQKILKWFPMAELELKRYEFKLQREGKTNG